MKKLLAFAIIFLFIGSNFVSGLNIQLKNTTIPLITDRGNTLYVGGSGPNNYTRIQNAINDSFNGDTIYVYSYSSPYYENIVIDRIINLIGEDKHFTVIDGNCTGDVIYVSESVDGGNIKGFTIKNSGNEVWEHAGIEVWGYFDSIIDNIIIDNFYGIKILNNWGESLYCREVLYNIVTNNEVGIDIYKNSGVVTLTDVYENYIANNSMGIIVSHEDDDDEYEGIRNNIYQNDIKNNEYGIIISLDINQNIFKNNVTDNKNGIILGGYHGLCYKNNIYQNNIERNEEGIILSDYCSGSCYNNKIYLNNLKNNNRGIFFTTGECGFCPFWNDIYQNNFINNNEGIFIRGEDSPFNEYSYNIYQNSIIGNIKKFCISAHDGNGVSFNNHINKNNISRNRKGILIYEDIYDRSTDNKIYQNNFIGNLFYNARDIRKNQWDNDTTGNYWDDYNGKDIDDDGIGDTPYNIRPYWKGNKDNYPLMKPVNNVTKILSIQQNSQNSQQSFSIPISQINGLGVAAITNNLATIDNHPPNVPEIAGPTSPKIGVEYYFIISTTDPDGDNVSYYIDWDDGTVTDWTGPYHSGIEVPVSHTWYKSGWYIVRYKAKDHPYEAESELGQHLFIVPPNSKVLAGPFIGISTMPLAGSLSVEQILTKDQSCKFNSFNDTIPPFTTHELNPPVPDGDNDWYISDVEVTLNAMDDISGVKEIKFQIDGGPVQTIPGDIGSFLVTTDSTMHTIKYWAIDNAGNVESQHTINFKQDQTVPEIDLTWDWKGKGKSLLHKSIRNSNSLQYFINFTANATDATSGMERVEFYLNSVLQCTVYGPGPEYKWELIWVPQPKAIFRAIAYDFAGLSAYDDFLEPCLSVTFDPGIYIFKNLLLPNNYTGYISRYFIWVTFYN